MEPSPILEARRLFKRYRAGTAHEMCALADVSISVARGSFTLLTGPSGCGKSTLLAILGALDRPSAGQVLFEDKDWSSFSEAELSRLRRKIGFVFQSAALVPGLTVWENITYPLIPRGVRRQERKERAKQLLERLSMSDKLGAFPQTLSGGEQQRVAIARALAGRPEVILADEPTSNLDPESATEVRSILRDIHAEGKTIFLASHDAEFVSLATAHYQLRAGKLSGGR